MPKAGKASGPGHQLVAFTKLLPHRRLFPLGRLRGLKVDFRVDVGGGGDDHVVLPADQELQRPVGAERLDFSSIQFNST